jgi:hypothetical protein
MAATINADNGVSSGSAGLKSSADSSGVLQLQTNGTAAVTVDTSQNVGIGTASPDIYSQGGKMFTVSNTASNSYAYTTLSGSGTGGGELDFGNQTVRHAAIASLSGSALAFYINNTNSGVAVAERMRITSAGNVGIGTDTPTEKMTVNGGLLVKGAFNNVSNGGAINFTYASNTGGIYAVDPTVAWKALDIGSSTTTFAIGAVEKMRIDSSGNVGIGTSAVGYADVTVLRQATTSTNATLSLVSGTSGYGRLFFGDAQNSAAEYDGFVQYDQGNRLMQFGTSQTERMRIDSSGNLLVGTTSATGLVVAQRNTAGGYSAAFGARAIGTANAQVAGIMFLPTFSNTADYTPRRAADIWGGFNGNWGGEFLVFGVGTGAGNDAGNQTVERMRIDAGGNLTITGATATKASGTTWANPSDQRLKDNIRDYVKGTTELMQVRVREWEYNGKGGTVEGMKGLGVIADEVMTVLPATVENYDAKLNADDEETTAIKKFDATEITWLLVKTVQEQQAVITQLQADVAALKGTP